MAELYWKVNGMGYMKKREGETEMPVNIIFDGSAQAAAEEIASRIDPWDWPDVKHVDEPIDGSFEVWLEGGISCSYERGTYPYNVSSVSKSIGGKYRVTVERID